MKRKMDSSSFDKEVIRRHILADIKRKEANRSKMLISSICIAVVFALTGCAVAVEMNEYSQAVEFFNEYKISTEGYTRSEIKAVYKDITRHTYSNSKTLELLNEISIEMFQNTLDFIDPSDYDKLLNDYYLQNSKNEIIENFGDTLYLDKRVDILDQFGGIIHSSVPEKQEKIIKQNGDETEWVYLLPEKYSSCELLLKFDGGIVVGGRVKHPEFVSGYDYAGVFVLNDNGELIFEHHIEENNSRYLLAEMSEDKIVLFGKSYVNSTSLVTVINFDGEVISESRYEKVPGAKTVTPKKILIDSDKIFLIDEIIYTDNTSGIRIVEQGFDGEWQGAVKYTEDECQYHFSDAIIKNGKIYIGAYYQKGEYEKFSVAYQKGIDHNLEYLKRFNSVLLVLDESQELSKAYTVEKAIPVKIVLKDSTEPAWVLIHPLKAVTVKVHNYLSSQFNAPPIDKKMIGVTQFEYIFDEDDKLAEKKETEVKIKDLFAFKDFYYS